MTASKYIVALEIGSSKIKGALGYIDSSDSLNVQAIEEEELIGCVRHGCIRNVAEVANTVRRIIQRIESRVAPRKVESVYVAIGGRSMMSHSREINRLLPGDVEVTRELLTQMKKEAKAITLSDKDVLAVVPRAYTIDKTSVDNPVGMVGSDIRIQANLVTARSLLKRNLELTLIDKMGLTINGIILRQLAQADLVLSSEERRLGCMFVDFGAETTTVSIYKYGNLQYLATLPMGSRLITLDIAHLNHLEEKAEELKKAGGNANLNPTTVPGTEHDDINFAEINNYVSCRAGEIIVNIKEQIRYANFTPAELPGGVIVVGRGAKLTGFNNRLAETLGMKVRSGSVMGGQLRIVDSNLVPSDNIDVLSILYIASHQPRECLSEIVEETPVEQPQEPLTEIEDTIPEVPDTSQQPRSSWFDKIRGLGKKVSDYIKEAPEDDSDFEDDVDS